MLESPFQPLLPIQLSRIQIFQKHRFSRVHFMYIKIKCCVFLILQSVTVEVQGSFSSPLGTESFHKSKSESCLLNPPVRVTSTKSVIDRSIPTVLAGVNAVGSERSSQCAVRFPKIQIGITSGKCCRWCFQRLLCLM